MKRARLVVLVASAALLALGIGLGRHATRASVAAHEGGDDADRRAAGGTEQGDNADPTAARRSDVAPTRTLHDRETRDALRARLVAAWSSAASLPTATAPRGAYTPMPEAPDGAVDSNYVRERIREDFIPMAQQCYDELLARTPDAGGRIVVNFTIVGDEKVGGVIDEASIGDASTLTDDRMATCFRESMMSMAFRPPKGAGKVTVEYPFELSPGDDEDGAP